MDAVLILLVIALLLAGGGYLVWKRRPRGDLTPPLPHSAIDMGLVGERAEDEAALGQPDVRDGERAVGRAEPDGLVAPQQEVKVERARARVLAQVLVLVAWGAKGVGRSGRRRDTLWAVGRQPLGSARQGLAWHDTGRRRRQTQAGRALALTAHGSRLTGSRVLNVSSSSAAAAAAAMGDEGQAGRLR